MPASSLLSEARAVAGISQRELATRAQTPQARISRIEKGLEEPSYAQLEKLIAACGLELEASVRKHAPADEDTAQTLADLAQAAELSRFLTSLAIAAERSS